MQIVYYSNVSENTHRFVQKLGHSAIRLPLRASSPMPEMTAPYMLIVPTYGGRNSEPVPRSVIKFLNNPANRDYLIYVVGAGNTNFGEDYCKAADRVAEKCKTFVVHRFELLGTQADVDRIRQLLAWQEEDVAPLVDYRNLL